MKRKIILSLMVIALVSALVGGATFALFTDQSTNSDNTFAAGTVKLNVGSQTYAVPINNMAPGDTINGSFKVKNDGTLKMWYKVTANKAGALFGGATPAAVTPANVAWTALEPGAETTINYSIVLPLAADNSYQGANGTLSFTVDAEQYANNPH